MLILASRSPRRAALLRAAGIRFRVVAPPVEEAPAGAAGGRYGSLVQRSALTKARAVASPSGKGRWLHLVLGADTIVVCGGRILGKPSSKSHAREMLELLSGRWHSVYSGLALVYGERYMTAYERTEVAFRPLSKKQIRCYIRSGEPMDKAGAYAIQGKGAALVRVIRGCYTNVIGLPIPKVVAMLTEFGKTLKHTHGRRRLPLPRHLRAPTRKRRKP